MSDRLSELIRQRALVVEHLAWLDREIADAKGKVDPAAPNAAVAVLLPATNPASDAATALAPPNLVGPPPSVDAPVPETEVILEQYRVTPTAVKQDVRKGCLLYFVGAFVVLGIVVTILYFAIGTR